VARMTSAKAVLIQLIAAAADLNHQSFQML
jgi:hypothetical protein